MTTEQLPDIIGFEYDKNIAIYMKLAHDVPVSHWKKMQPSAQWALFMFEEYGIITEDYEI